MFFALLSFAAFASATPKYACDKVSPIDTSCALYIAQTDIINLNFTHPKWNLNDWNVYVIQDGKYLSYYHDVVTSRIDNLCTGVLPPATRNEVVAKLSFAFNVDKYGQRYNVDAKNAKETVILQNYLKHYEAQTTCYDILSASMPCLCIYAPIAKALGFNHKDDKFTDSRATWISDNADIGSWCNIVRAAVGENFQKGPYDTSMRHDLEFFNQTEESKLATDKFVPKRLKRASDDL